MNLGAVGDGRPRVPRGVDIGSRSASFATGELARLAAAGAAAEAAGVSSADAGLPDGDSGGRATAGPAAPRSAPQWSVDDGGRGGTDGAAATASGASAAAATASAERLRPSGGGAVRGSGTEIVIGSVPPPAAEGAADGGAPTSTGALTKRGRRRRAGHPLGAVTAAAAAAAAAARSATTGDGGGGGSGGGGDGEGRGGARGLGVKDGEEDDDRFSERDSDDEPEGVGGRHPPPGGEDEDEEAVSLHLAARQYVKLEVIQAREISYLLHWLHASALVGLLYSVAVIILANTQYLLLLTESPSLRQGRPLRLYQFPPAFNWFTYIANTLVFVYAAALFVVYAARIARLSSRNRTHEQVWVLMLTAAVAVYTNPYEVIVRLLQLRGVDVSVYGWYTPVTQVYAVVQTSAFTMSTLFYVWASVHSYRILNGRIRWTFYVPKLVVLAAYVGAKAFIHLYFDVYLSELPFASLVAMLFVYSETGMWPRAGVIAVSLITVAEVALVGWILRSILVTKAVLKATDYMKFRTKQIGFRFFLYHNLTFYVVYWMVFVMLLLAMPAGAQVVNLAIHEVSYLEVQYVPCGILVLLLAYVTVDAYVNLPADAVGFRGWFVPRQPKALAAAGGSGGTTTDHSGTPTASQRAAEPYTGGAYGGADAALDDEMAPITYRKREPPSFSGMAPDLQTNCFVMQTHVMLFNFAWLVYYYGTPKLESFTPDQNTLSFVVSEYISEASTDTHVLVVDGADRIVVAFKGTTSTRNLKTDLNIYHVRAASALPTRLLEDTPESIANEGVLGARDFKRAKIHKGFALAYASVAAPLLRRLQSLLAERRRPIFLTGHSLGGALATICSFDLFLRLGLGRRELFVSTFGAPRPGNDAFRRLYDAKIPIHWRIVVGPDVVAKLPKVGYRHVGKKVLLNSSGELFLDPNALELKLWHGDAASILYHRKASYLLAMRAWCERHHGSVYTPPFWSFPYSTDDWKRFGGAGTGTGSPKGATRSGSLFGGSSNGGGGSAGGGHSAGSSVGSVLGRRLSRRGNTRILKLDAMVEALDGGGVGGGAGGAGGGPATKSEGQPRPSVTEAAAAAAAQTGAPPPPGGEEPLTPEAAAVARWRRLTIQLLSTDSATAGSPFVSVQL
ncbi:hypothetical protein MMPV_001219 [Pyropia vietnamensis]